jgi:hypothetical protein
MTVINGIEIDIGVPYIDEIRSAIINNYPIDNVLHVIIVVSNPCQFARRYILAREFIKRMTDQPNIQLYVVELAYGDHGYYVTSASNKNHLRLHASVAMWHKENMINIGVKRLLPPEWRAFAWIDADIEFENSSWALDTLKVLNGCRDVVQLFSHAVDMDKYNNAMSIFPSFGFQYTKQRPYGGAGINMWHPGYAWAMSRKAYDKIGGLYDLSILGAGDHNMAFSFIGNSMKSLNEQASNGYKQSLLEFEARAHGLRLGYVTAFATLSDSSFQRQLFLTRRHAQRQLF